MRKTLLLLAIAIILTACSENNIQLSDDTGEMITVEDSAGRFVSLNGVPKTVVVLSSSLADLWILAGGQVVGTTSDAFKRDLDLSEEQTQIIGTIKDPNPEAILSLNPDLLILTDDIAGHQALLPILTKAGISHYIANVDTLEDYLFVLKQFTEITGQKQNFTIYGENVKLQIDALLSHLPQKEIARPSYLFLRAFSSGINVIARDHVVCDILKDAEIVNIAESETSLLNDLSMEAILKEDPDFIFIITMGSDTEKALQSLKDSLYSQPAWSQLSAVQSDRVIILPKELYHYKPNGSWDTAYAYLLEILYPETY